MDEKCSAVQCGGEQSMTRVRVRLARVTGARGREQILRDAIRLGHVVILSWLRTAAAPGLQCRYSLSFIPPPPLLSPSGMSLIIVFA